MAVPAHRGINHVLLLSQALLHAQPHYGYNTASMPTSLRTWGCGQALGAVCVWHASKGVSSGRSLLGLVLGLLGFPVEEQVHHDVPWLARLQAAAHLQRTQIHSALIDCGIQVSALGV